MTTEKWKQLCARPPVLLDGAWGSQLQQRGLPPGAAPESWNLSHPEEVQSTAEAYVQAGSQIILTNTFGANRFVLDRHQLAERAAEINRTGAQLSRNAAGSKAFVFGSVGPSGKMLIMGDLTKEELAAAFSEQVEALQKGGVDGLVIETMSDLDEAVLATKAAAATGLPVAACMVFDSGPARDHTMMGITPAMAAEALEQAGAWAIGANCGQGPGDFLKICEHYRKATDLPIWMKPNAGMPEMKEGKTVYPMTAELFARASHRLWEDGNATFIGGCCGTGPTYIQALHAQLKR